MPVSSSAWWADAVAQIDTRVFVTQVFVMADGAQVVRRYLADPAADHAAVLAARAAALAESEIDDEIEDLLGG